MWLPEKKTGCPFRVAMRLYESPTKRRRDDTVRVVKQQKSSRLSGIVAGIETAAQCLLTCRAVPTDWPALGRDRDRITSSYLLPPVAPRAPASSSSSFRFFPHFIRHIHRHTTFVFGSCAHCVRCLNVFVCTDRPQKGG